MTKKKMYLKTHYSIKLLNSRQLLLNLVFTGVLVPSLILSEVAVASDTQDEQCLNSQEIEFKANDIFDLDEEGTIFIHEWANFLHVKTKEVTLRYESNYLLDKCNVNEDDLAELERTLRGRKYLRDAKVEFKDNKVMVETWDNWSLMPTIDFSRKGGKTKHSVGIKDRNLFGLGIDTEFESYKDVQRSGYKLKTHFPLFLGDYIRGSVVLTDNDDGKSNSYTVTKPFTSFDTLYSFDLSKIDHSQVDSQFGNGETISTYRHEFDEKSFSYRWLINDSVNYTFRMGLSYYEAQRHFSDFELDANREHDREYQHFIIGASFITKNFKELSNINLINQIEDFNLGWELDFEFGNSTLGGYLSPTNTYSLNINKGFEPTDKSSLFLSANWKQETYAYRHIPDYERLDLKLELYHRFNELWGGYVKSSTTLSQNPYIDQPVVLGAESGLRGYPMQFTRGENTTALTVEARYYPQINLYKMFELGGAVFLDAGKSDGKDPNYKDIEFDNSLLASFGVGARIYSTRSSGTKVVHIDLVKPLSNHENINGVELRLTTKHSF